MSDNPIPSIEYVDYYGIMWYNYGKCTSQMSSALLKEVLP